MIIAWIIAVLVSGIVSPRPAIGGERFLANPKLATACQAAITSAATTFVPRKLKLLDQCAAAASKCLQTVSPPDDDDEDDPIELCLERASLRCEKLSEKVLAEEEALAERIVKGCSALDPADLLRAGGVGYDLVAEGCQDFGITPTDATSVAACVVQQHECMAELLFEAQQPRAAELFGLVGTDLGGTCLEDFGGSGEGVGDTKLGKTLERCQQGVKKVSSAFVTKKIGGLGRCLAALFDCVQLQGSSPACLAKARQSCDKGFGGIESEAIKLEPGFEKACRNVSFAALAPDTGLNLSALVDYEICDTFGQMGLANVGHYKNCVHRQHECMSDELLRFAVPRAEELLGLIGRMLPGAFFCPREDDEDL